jgi:hypothetical protein
MSFVLVRPAQSVEVCFDPWYFLFLSFLILYILCRNYQLVEYIQYMLSEDGTVQLVWVLVHLRPSYTLCLVARRSFWSLRDFFWISLIIINLQIPFVWGEPVSESIVGFLCCCPSACHSCLWGLFKRWCFGWISHFFDSKAFEYHIDYIEITNSWNICQSFCLRTVECSLCECWSTQ